MTTDAQLDIGEYVLLEHLGSTRLGSLFNAREAVADIYDKMQNGESVSDVPSSFRLKLDCADLMEALKAFHDDVTRLCGAMTQAVDGAPEDAG